MKKTKMEKGITLIALIITIVVLLILAVVAISEVKGESIVEYAKNARDDYQIKADEEQETINGYLTQIEGSLSEEITWKKTSEGNLAVGSTVVTSTGENFYVIGFKDNNETVVLLAKDCIDTKKLVQSANAEPVAFCEDSVAGYWGGQVEIKEEEPIPSTHTAAYAADRYGAKLGGKGMLPTEPYVNDDITFGFNGKSSSDFLDYWIGVASVNPNEVCCLSGGFYSDPSEGGVCLNADYRSHYGVRPVVEISTSKIL